MTTLQKLWVVILSCITFRFGRSFSIKKATPYSGELDTTQRSLRGAALARSVIQDYEENNKIQNNPLYFQTVYHGSGVSFDRFNTAQYGLSGEGSMSFGYGTYVTGSKDIALGCITFRFRKVIQLKAGKRRSYRRSRRNEQQHNQPSSKHSIKRFLDHRHSELRIDLSFVKSCKGKLLSDTIRP